MKTLLFIGNMGAGELIVIALVVLLLFGGKKIPELMKGLGRGVRSFKLRRDGGGRRRRKEVTAPFRVRRCHTNRSTWKR